MAKVKAGEYLVGGFLLFLYHRANCSKGGTDKYIDKQNPDNLGQQSTDSGVVPNLKWRFSDSKVRLFNGGWLREQVIQDLPQSHDISAAQQHLEKGAIRELHWHRVVSCYPEIDVKY
jgi:oxalate decarboxylase/phosphoglucose isomerase-like protein (cupin superfamily)